MISALILAMAASAAGTSLQPDADFDCNACEAWNQPQKPFHIYGNTYYVGTEGLSALLIIGEDDSGEPAHVLIDGGLPQSAALIDANINALGFDTRDVRYILNSHAHFDHAGGINALQRYSGAEVLVSEPALISFETGQVPPHDPQAGYAPENGFPPVNNVTSLPDGGTFAAGGTTFTLNLTPGHAPGGTSWSWPSCEAGRCLNVLYAEGFGPISAPGFLFTAPQDALDGRTTASQLQESIHFLSNFDCDIMLAPHPFRFSMEDKLASQDLGMTENPFHVPEECAAWAERFQTALDTRLQEESLAATLP